MKDGLGDLALKACLLFGVDMLEGVDGAGLLLPACYLV